MSCPLDTLATLQKQFNSVIDQVVGDLMKKNGNEYPDLKKTNLVPNSEDRIYHAIAGYYGGFNYKLVKDEKEWWIDTESWSRVCGGSGIRHKITVNSVEVLEEGFV
eukprot:TRINITY_DN1988_c0_g1_i1.p1 TRINITY_DN1988_c0_g1~~TRINITY_DN1988_c0_g1_i1.p1  ORF type:complete len:106 (-),score=28.29 TRINITY_DN1988_c0_g1_i1:125-442(-)